MHGLNGVDIFRFSLFYFWVDQINHKIDYGLRISDKERRNEERGKRTFTYGNQSRDLSSAPR